MPTPNTGIPYVPEGTLDPAAGLNLSLNVIDALLQTNVIEVGRNDPPGSPSDGDMYIVGVGTGAWALEDDNLARYVAEGSFWQFYEAGVNVHSVTSGGLLYVYDGSWLVINPALRIKTVSTDTYDLTDDDAFYTILFTHVSGCVVTVRAQADHAFRSGFWATLVQRTTGQVSVEGSGAATVNTSASFEPATAQRYSPITVERYASNDWQVNGERAGTS